MTAAENAATDPQMALQKIQEASEWFDEQGYSLWASEMHWAHSKLAALLAERDAAVRAAEQAQEALRQIVACDYRGSAPREQARSIARAALTGEADRA